MTSGEWTQHGVIRSASPPSIHFMFPNPLPCCWPFQSCLWLPIFDTRETPKPSIGGDGSLAGSKRIKTHRTLAFSVDVLWPSHKLSIYHSRILFSATSAQLATTLSSMLRERKTFILHVVFPCCFRCPFMYFSPISRWG